ncbi:uncharacterized protein LOC144710996 [Wolffia australiana]
MVARKRVVAVVDRSSGAKNAALWALNHVVGAGDIVTLLHVLPRRGGDAARKANSDVADLLVALCRSIRSDVEVEALALHGPKLRTVLNHITKLEAAVLVLSQPKPSSSCCFGAGDDDDFVERCVNEADCLAVAVRKRGGGVGGYFVTTRTQKNFWLLA